MKPIALAAMICVCAATVPAQTPVPNAPPPPSTLWLTFQDAACREKPNGGYCGTGTNHQQFYRCHAGEIVEQRACPGGCEPGTLECRQQTGVKAIDRARPPE